MKEHPVLTNSRKDFTDEKVENEILNNLGAPHIDSFNYMISEGLDDCVQNLPPIEFELPNGNPISFQIDEATISPPTIPNTISVGNKKIYPSECRQRACTYQGQLDIRISWSVNGEQKQPVYTNMGEVPIMLKSSICNLSKLTPSQLVAVGEHERDWGGTFIIKGHERLIRMLLLTRKNYPIALKRGNWKNRGHHFSDLGIHIRSVMAGQTSTNNCLHFLNNGTLKYMFTRDKYLSFAPVCLLLKALVNYTDEHIYSKLTKGYEENLYYISCIQNMMREIHEEGIHTHEDCKEYLGRIFRGKLFMPEWKSDLEVSDYLLKHTILIHLDDNVDKFNLMVFMIQKLFQLVQNNCKLDGTDSTMMHEILMGGHLYQKVLGGSLRYFMIRLKNSITKIIKISDTKLTQSEFLLAIKYSGNIGKFMERFLATGSLSGSDSLGLQQSTGLVVMAENINRMRYMSHFRAVHRGAFFTEMRTTEVRQLLPDAWGFICPVHTPDGTPCGLLNHLTVNCIVSNSPDKNKVANISKELINLGMIPVNSTVIGNMNESLTVMLEGRILGEIPETHIRRIVDKLRLMKIEGEKIPNTTEIVLVPNKKGGQYPGLYLFVGSARMMRPVVNLAANKIELIGTFEQIYMDICITPDESYHGVTTHMELSKTSFLSNLANLIPMPDCNQSPRNMYQCQMGKQTMGTPCHNWNLQAETKLYRLQTPSTPLFRPVHHDNIEMDDFAMGVNAIVAVISYTGYDMEDAMIINKAAFERGLAHGSVYKSEFIELRDDFYFARDPNNPNLEKYLDNDGFPHPGMILSYNFIYYCYFDTDNAVYKTVKYKGQEKCYVERVRLCGAFNTNAPRKACITVRIPRNPMVGDKFASRAGQKGICSQKWPAEDLPFTESGLIPDIVFNPHGFPSRMTIAMMIEIMAGKTASLHGLVHDATPFKFTEKDTAIDYFGRLLEAGGYNYYGTEKMYSGIDGRELKADIFFGVVHYQRLRHMVSDKWQVRSTGPINAVTHQPIKGRKGGGGVRFGEMERDALIAHGASFLLLDRLMHCSDKVSAIICRKCGTLLGPLDKIVRRNISGISSSPATCRLCQDNTEIGFIEIPYIFKFLVTQLSSVNINVKLNFSSI